MWLVAAVAVALLVLPWVIALARAHHHHVDATAVGVLAAVSIPLSALWIAWVTLAKGGGSGTSTGSLSMAQVADQLAIAVGAQWNAEAAIRRLNDPYPLPVSWAAADATLTDSWNSLVKLATSGAGWPEPPLRGTWASGPDDLAGEGSELADVLAWVPTGRLVVLGEPGSGKTMLMVRLVLDLLSRRTSGDPVPFLASVASWNPAEQDLQDWLSAQLLINHSALASPPPAGMTESNRAAALLGAGLILPVLDGLDEIPEHVRGPAISRINDSLRPGEQVAVTCRTQQFRDVVRPQDGTEVTLRAAAAIQLCSLDADIVRGYLSDDAGGPVARARWVPVFAMLGTEAPAGQALSTPLMVGLARAIYNPRPGELIRTLPDPAKELCSHDLADRKAVEAVLFDGLIPAAYRSPTENRWTARQVGSWLEVLARHTQRTIGSADIAWWQLSRAVPRIAVSVVSALVAGLVVGLVLLVSLAPVDGMNVTTGLVAGLGVGVAAAVTAVLVTIFGSIEAPARGIRLSVGGLVAGLVAGVVAGIWLGIWAGLGTALWFGLLFGLLGVPGDLTGATSPSTMLARDRRVALLLMVGGWLGGSLLAGSGATSSGGGLRNALLIGAALGLAGGLAISMIKTAWPSYMLVRSWLALCHRLPWPLMSFLADAHRRGVLRQAGAVYQFRHIELQHRLADRDANEQQANSPTA